MWKQKKCCITLALLSILWGFVFGNDQGKMKGT